jgi:hypothetical protein
MFFGNVMSQLIFALLTSPAAQRLYLTLDELDLPEIE